MHLEPFMLRTRATIRFAKSLLAEWSPLWRDRQAQAAPAMGAAALPVSISLKALLWTAQAMFMLPTHGITRFERSHPAGSLRHWRGCLAPTATATALAAMS